MNTTTPNTPARTWIRRIALILTTLAVLAAVALAVGSWMAERKMHRTVDIAVQPVPYRDSPEALARGRYLYASRGCVDCHGSNGAGRMFLDDGKGLRIAGPNLTPGAGHVVASYQPQDWVRAIRHGAAPGGRPLMIMPSEDYNRFTDDDLASLVAYIRQLPSAEGGGAIVELPLPVKALYGFGLIQDAAAKIDHSRPPEQPVPEGVTLAHGAYVANMCKGCHGPQLAGGKIPGGPPDWPAAANLTPGAGTVMGHYAQADTMVRMFQTGTRPDGTAIKVMPFESLRAMSETDLRALHLYLQSLPQQPHG